MQPLRPIHFLLVILAWTLLSSATRAEDQGAAEIRGARLRELADQLRNPATPRRAIPATQVTLSVHDTPLVDVLREIEKQTGNKWIDERQASGEANATAGPRVSLNLTNDSYWVAIDTLLDAANVAVSNQSGSDALAITDREPGAAPRGGGAAYAGPFRVQVLEVQSQRSSRDTRANSLKLQLEVTWEPRLRPLAVSQAAADLAGTIDAIAPLVSKYPAANFTAEVPLGTQAIDLTLPFELPPRRTEKITSLQGKLRVLVPGRQARFQFSDLAHAAGKSERVDDTEVIVDDVRKNNEIWEVHMRLKLDARNPALDAQRGWAFDNRSFLVDGNGETIENAGLETTSETEHEVGVAYFFDVTADLDGLTWVYETPAAIAETQVDFELRDVELP